MKRYASVSESVRSFTATNSRSVPYFSEFPEPDLKRLCSRVRVHSFMPGEDIVQAGHEGSSLFIIGRGRAEVFTPGGRRIAELGAGEFFGEFSLLEPQPRTATVRALTPCTLLELARDVLMPYLDSAPHLHETLKDTYRRRKAELEGEA